MADDPTPGTSTGESDLSRRGYLAAAGGLGAGLTSGCTGRRWPLEGGSEDGGSATRDPDREGRSDAGGSRGDAVGGDGDGDDAEGREDFLWLGRALWERDAVRENLFAFARRHDLAVVLVKRRSGEPLETLEPSLASASEFDLNVWLNVGLLDDLPAETFVSDGGAREAHLDWLRAATRLHGEYFDSGRVVLWQEAPVMGQWVEGGEWNETAIENLLEFGPEIFAAQRRAVAAANDALDVGLFVHFPYIVDSKRPEVFETLAGSLRGRDAVPDFAFTDFYRGWYEKDAGPEPANAAVRSLVRNARTALGDRPVFYLGQSHTINPNHTPSKQAMLMNLRASIESGAAGLGWYVRSGYVPTESGFDPFVPNVEGAEVDGDAVNTLTVARDRFLYPWTATLETGAGFDSGDAFDLWLIGEDLGFHDHRLSVRTAAGEWEYVGDFGGYADGDYPEGSEVTDRATVFRALDRDRLLGDGSLECRVETAEGASRTDLAAFVMPCEPSDYVSEREAAALARGERPLERYSLGRTSERIALSPGERRRVRIPVTGSGGASLYRLRHPEFVDTLRRMASLEESEDVDPSARFDLWVSGAGLGEPSAVPSVLDRRGAERAPTDVSVVVSRDDIALCLGLERDEFLDGGGLELARDTDASVDAWFAMPYAGRAAFRSPARAAALLADQPGEARRFSLDHAVRQ